MNMYAVRSEKTASEKDQTNIPRRMKSGFERSSGFSFDDVRVHYNSEKPAQLHAHAYTQGNNVYVAPGQEKHLPHELGHVVQQKSDMVEPNGEIGGFPLNDDESLESGADKIAEEAENASASEYTPIQAKFKNRGVVQRFDYNNTYNLWAGPIGTGVAALGLAGGIASFFYQKNADRKHKYIEEVEKYADAACDAREEQIAAVDMYNSTNDPTEKDRAHAEAAKQKSKVRRNYAAAIKKAGAMDKGNIGDQPVGYYNENNLRPNNIEKIKDQNVKDALIRAYTAFQESISPQNNLNNQNNQQNAAAHQPPNPVLQPNGQDNDDNDEE